VGSAETSCCINYHYMLHDIKVWTDKINKRYELFKMLSTIIMCLNENTVCYFKNCTKLRKN